MEVRNTIYSTYGELNYGDCFMYENNTYIKTNAWDIDSDGEREPDSAINLENGHVVQFGIEEKVLKVKVTAFIEDGRR